MTRQLLRLTQSTLRPGTRQLIAHSGRRRHLSRTHRVALAHALREQKKPWGSRALRELIKRKLT